MKTSTTQASGGTPEDRPSPPADRPPWWSPAGAAGVAGTAAVTTMSMALHTFVPAVPFLPLAIAQVLVRTTPGAVDSFFIDRLGHLAARLAVAGVCGAFLLLGVPLGRIVPAVGRGRARSTTLGGAICLLPLWIVSVVLYPTAPQFVTRPVFAVVTLGMYVAGGLVAGLVYRRLAPMAPDEVAVFPQRRIAAPNASRRAFLASLGVGAAAAALGVFDLSRYVEPKPDPGLRPLRLRNLTPVHPSAPAPGDAAFARIPGLSPEITSNGDFYIVNEELVAPSIDPTTWSLSVDGMVGHPLTIPYDTLLGYPAVERYQTLECISNEVGGPYISNARWAGIPVREILDRASVHADAVEVVFTAAGGYSDSMPIEQAMDPATLIAVAMNGTALPRAHGFPARVLGVGTFGMKNPKWLMSISVADAAYQGFWERRGWSKRAIVRTEARIDTPRDGTPATQAGTIAGVAFAGDRGISKVEVSTDGGRTWSAARLKTALSPYTWRLWMFEPPPGSARSGATVVARAYDGTGAVQPSHEAQPYPNGASGYDSITLS